MKILRSLEFELGGKLIIQNISCYWHYVDKMDLGDVANKEQFFEIVINELKRFGVKYQKPKKKKHILVSIPLFCSLFININIIFCISRKNHTEKAFFVHI